MEEEARGRHSAMMTKRNDQQNEANPESQSADDYLSRLAQSILAKDKNLRPTAPSPAQQRILTPSDSRVSVRRPPTPDLSPQSTEASDTRKLRNALSVPKDWVREVDVYDDRGHFIPGTILLFEDGNVGVYKERNPAKEYDIVYMLRNTGNVSPQGMPLFNYEVEPIGRLSSACFEQFVKTDRWERDMLVFHLLKYKDHSHIPEIVAAPPTQPQAVNDESFSSWAVRKLEATEMPILTTAPEEEKPKLTRGRNMTIVFGPSQKWDAVYWGKDELGHVVAHSTHDRWSLLHLDLDRFKDSLTFHGMVDAPLLKKMEKDFASA